MTRTKQQKLDDFARAGGMVEKPPKYLPGLGTTIMPIFPVDAATRVVHRRGRAYCATHFIHDSYVVQEYRGRDAKPLGLVCDWLPPPPDWQWGDLYLGDWSKGQNNGR